MEDQEKVIGSRIMRTHTCIHPTRVFMEAADTTLATLAVFSVLLFHGETGEADSVFGGDLRELAVVD